MSRRFGLGTLQACRLHLAGESLPPKSRIIVDNVLQVAQVRYLSATDPRLLADNAPDYAVSPGIVEPFTASNGRTYKNAYFLAPRAGHGPKP